MGYSRYLLSRLHQWMLIHRQKVLDGSGTAKALDYSLKRWTALTRYLDDGAVPIDNNWVENQIRPWALGRSNWLFAGSLRSGQRAAAVMTLIQSAKLNGHDPYVYLKYVLTRLPMQKNNAIDALLAHNWMLKLNDIYVIVSTRLSSPCSRQFSILMNITVIL